MSAKRKADRTDIIAEKPKLWCTHHVKRVWWNVPEKATQTGGVLKSAKSKNVANGLKASEKVRKGRKSEREHCRVLWNGIRHRKWSQSVVLLSSFVVLERESSQIIAKVSQKCRTWFVMRIGDMGSHHLLPTEILTVLSQKPAKEIKRQKSEIIIPK